MKRRREDRKKMKKYRVMIVGNEKLGQNITYFLRELATNSCRRWSVAICFEMRGFDFSELATKSLVASSSPILSNEQLLRATVGKIGMVDVAGAMHQLVA